MVALSKSPPDNVKKVHCPICGGRLCDVKENERIYLDREKKSKNGIIIKCYKCGTIALEEGVEIKALSSMLGHSDVAFTMNTYVHATKKLKTSAADKMEAAFEIGYSTVMNAQCGLKEA